MNTELINLFGRDNALIYHSIELILTEEKDKSYFFMDQLEFKRISMNSLKNSNQIFWMELLNRVRYSSMINLIRSKKWIDSIVLGEQNQNLLLFCSSLRGCIESGADSYFTFAPIPAFVIKEMEDIKSVFDQNSPSFLKCKPLEDALIHYTHAGSRIPKGDGSKIYNAKPMSQYIKYCDDKEGSLSNLYQVLSSYVHPSRESVLSYVNITDHSSGEYLSVKINDNEEIRSLIDRYSRLLNRVFHLCIFPSLLNLKALSMIGIESLNVRWIDAFNFESSWLWKDMLDKIEQSNQV
jgi:hypothetical protein